MLKHLEYELGWLQKFHDIRPEFLDSFFITCNHLDTYPFYLFLASSVLLFKGHRWASRCFILLAATVVTNFFLKNLFMQPRPYILDPTLALIDVHSVYGIPSGAAQGATIIAMLVATWCQQKWIKFLAVGYVLLVCCSRLYIGAHFFTDLIAGIAVGFTLFKLIMSNIDKIESLLSRVHPIWYIGSLFTLGLIRFAFVLQLEGPYQHGLEVSMALSIYYFGLTIHDKHNAAKL